MPLSPIYPAICTIALNASLSTAVQMVAGGSVMQERGTLLHVALPSQWTAGVLTIQGVPPAQADRLSASQKMFTAQTEQDAWPWVNLRDLTGAEYTLQATAGVGLIVAPADFLGWWALRFRSGTASVPVAQLAARELSLGLRSFE